MDIKIVETHFNDLKTALEAKGDKKAYVLIIEYLLNFLGCLSLGAMDRKKLAELSRNENISDLTAGQWANLIERILELSRGLQELERIQSFFLTADKKRLQQIKRWLDLRNTLTHDIILIDDKKLEQIFKDKLLDPGKIFEWFTAQLKQIAIDWPHLLKSSFFHVDKNSSLFIYAGIEDDYRIKYKHFKLQPLIVQEDNFPLTYKKVFISLKLTAQNILVGEDKITAQIRTMCQRNGITFQLWINGKKTQERKENIIDWSSVSFETAGLDDIKDGEMNTVEMKVLQGNRGLDSSRENIFFYKKLPKPIIKLEGIEEKKIPVDKAIDLKLRIESKFDIRVLQVTAFSPDNALEIFSQPKCDTYTTGTDETSSCILQVMATTIGEFTVMVKATYSDKNEVLQTIDGNFEVIATPNFYEPQFVGAKRQHDVALIQQNKKHYLITGEGGSGKSRLIQEALSKIKYKEITVYATSQLADEIADTIGYSFDRKKNISQSDKRSEIVHAIEQMAKADKENVLWLKDCHEIKNQDERDFLRTLLERTSATNLRFIIESRDSSWGQDAERLISEIKKADIEHISLERLPGEDMKNITDNIFTPNKFGSQIEVIVKKSDGIVYILLTILKKLYDRNCFTSWNDIWEIREDSGIEQELQSLEFNNVIKMDVEDTLKILDANGLGVHARELLKYLCIKEIPIPILESLLSISSSHVHCLLELLESSCIIKSYEKWPHENELIARLNSLSTEEFNGIFGKNTESGKNDEDAIAKETSTKRSKKFKAISFHHQLKENYYREKYLPEEIMPDYIIRLAIKWDNNIEDFDYEFFEPGWLTEEFRNLSKSNLSEKLDFLVFNEAIVPEGIMSIFLKYGDDISKEQAISYAEHALLLIEQASAHLDRLKSEGFDKIKHQIEEFFEQKGIAENDYLAFKAELEYDSLRYYMDYLLQKEQGTVQEKTMSFFGTDSRYEEYEPNQDITLFSATVHLTDYFLKNRDILEEVYDRLDNIRICLAVLESERYGFGFDVNFSWVHSTGILLSIGSERTTNRKDEYIQSMYDMLSSPPIKRPLDLMNFIGFHRRIMQDNPMLIETLNNVDKKIRSLLLDSLSEGCA